ncbi:hypothetical protein SAMN02745150_00995 [Brevinema andersonii]|uniref:Uncharacterized protein n=1 Tax=Brevinema andersonii TaxID=34097 RepID=A0A1I1E7Y3_BREAD|nr:hypothetical protein SAMN02745150_00995 [Brevinema andersonii]
MKFKMLIIAEGKPSDTNSVINPDGYFYQEVKHNIYNMYSVYHRNKCNIHKTCRLLSTLLRSNFNSG